MKYAQSFVAFSHGVLILDDLGNSLPTSKTTSALSSSMNNSWTVLHADGFVGMNGYWEDSASHSNLHHQCTIYKIFQDSLTRDEIRIANVVSSERTEGVHSHVIRNFVVTAIFDCNTEFNSDGYKVRTFVA